jgi:hypothetical protein
MSQGVHSHAHKECLQSEEHDQASRGSQAVWKVASQQDREQAIREAFSSDPTEESEKTDSPEW